MNINKISTQSMVSGRNYNEKYMSNLNHSIRFTGNNDTFTRRGLTNKQIKGLSCLTAALMALSAPFEAFAAPAKKITNYKDMSVSQLVSVAQDNESQRNQRYDAPSLTFDLTGNWAPEKIHPLSSLAYLSQNPGVDLKFANLGDIITNLYGIEDTEENKNLTYLVAYGILKANPSLMEKVTDGIVDFQNGDVANIDPELILATDYTIEGMKVPVFLPSIAPLVETAKDNKSSLVSSFVIRPKNADKYGQATCTFDSRKLKNLNSESELMELVNTAIKDAYNLQTVDSYAGDAIWHAIELYYTNYDETAFSNEGNVRNVMWNYVKRNGELSLVFPSAPVTVITQGKETNVNQLMFNKKTNEGVISYVSPDRAVVSTSELSGSETNPIEILDLYYLDGETTLRDAYELEPERNEGLVTSAFRQIIDNNDDLLAIYGNGVISADMLYKPMSGLTNAENAKINLQPLAYEHVQAPQQNTAKQTKKPTATPTYETPTPEPKTPTPEPNTPTPEPKTPTPEPNTPTPEPNTPTPEPNTPTPEPNTPTPEPNTPTPEPNTPTPEPKTPTPEPKTPTPEPGTCTPPPTVDPDPSVPPTMIPIITDKPTKEPTDKPTKEPTDKPTKEPTDKPTKEPTQPPTDAPCPPYEIGDTTEEIGDTTEEEEEMDFGATREIPYYLTADNKEIPFLTADNKIKLKKTLG